MFDPVTVRPRSKTAFTLKDELSRQDYSKENILDRANKKDKEHFGQKVTSSFCTALGARSFSFCALQLHNFKE